MRPGDRERVAMAAAFVGFAALFALVRANRSAALDLAISLKLQQSRSPALAAVMAAASWPGFPPQSRVVPPLVIGGWLLARRPRAAFFQLLAWGTALISTVVKTAVRRPRPLAPEVQVVVAPLGGSSFPSGHVLTYVGFYGFLAHLLSLHVSSPAARRIPVFGLVALIALVGPSRVQQGHHWATDVLASYLLGLAYLLALTTAYPVRPRAFRVVAPAGRSGHTSAEGDETPGGDRPMPVDDSRPGSDAYRGRVEGRNVARKGMAS